MIVGDQRQYQYLGSLDLGAVRLANVFFMPNESEPVPPARYALLQRHVRDAAVRMVHEVREYNVQLGFGSSGTIENLTDIAMRTLHNRMRKADGCLSHADLKQVIEMLCALPNIATMADIARQHDKRVILHEMWLYKANTTQPSMSNASAEMERLNSYSFWAPLDQKFLATVARVARAKNIEYISALSPSAFYAYLEYDPKLQTMPYNQMLASWNAQVAPNMNAGKYTATGELYRQLIGGAR